MVNITSVVQNGLCTMCGTCVGVCPVKAVTMDISESGLYLPRVQEEKCTQCGLCVECCPGHRVDFEDLNRRFFGVESIDDTIGNHINCYVARSRDWSIRYNGSSGGVVTHLLISALENGLIDGALVTRMKKENPLEPESFIAKTKEDILSASGSKYCPVAANVALRDIIEQDGKFAVVGLPCHIHGVRKAETVINGLSAKIVLHIGLFCSHTLNFWGTKILLKKLGIIKEDIVKLSYRGSGWPGLMTVTLKNGQKKYAKFLGGWDAYWNLFSPFFFTPIRCAMCPDQSNELSDLSVGDAWLPELVQDKIGTSIVVTRTRHADNMIKKMHSDGYLSIKEISSTKVKESQAFSLSFKKESYSNRLSLLNKVGKTLPSIQKSRASHPLSLLGSIMSYASIQVSSNKKTRSALSYIPMPIFRLYSGIFKFLFLLSKSD